LKRRIFPEVILKEEGGGPPGGYREWADGEAST
jgi:hypothetical protein